jgi:hypothetical protein
LFGETILDVVYDIKAQDNNIEFIEIAEKAMHVGLEAAIPGQFLVDVFPICSPCPSPCTELGSSHGYSFSEVRPVMVSWSQIQTPGIGMETDHSQCQRSTFCVCKEKNGSSLITVLARID